MVFKWDKKRIIRLKQADEDVIEQWLDEFVSVIYTWMYYQAGADAEIAAELTADTFKRAVRELEHFNPDSESMAAWLREQAKQARDEGLAVRQIKPQRPWAWSHLPDDVLYGLSQFRNEPLSEAVTNNPFVREIVQAALVEMEAPNRELMKRRYNHLETAEQIADEIGANIQNINDRLYRCRHFFRRVFVQLLQSANPEFSESSSSGSLELLDMNLEKLLSSTNMVQAVRPKDKARIREIVLAAARETAPLKNAGINKKNFVIGISAGIAVAVLLLLGIFVWFTVFATTQETEPPGPVTTPQAPPTTPAAPVINPEEAVETIDEEELRRVIQLGQEGDLTGLLEVLKTGQYVSQRTAALFIGELGDEGAIGMLEEAEMRWYPNGPADNPFAQAITQIEERLLAESGAIIEEPNIPQAADANEAAAAMPGEPEPTEEPAAVKPAISGTATDFSGDPMSNAAITLSQNPLYGAASDIQIIGQTATNDAGQYRFENPPTGALFIDCRAALDGLAISRSIWRGQEANCRVEFGGKPSVFGLLEGEPASVDGQILYLSDTPDPANAAFRAESITDTEGRFSFTGVSAGSYYLLNSTDTNRLVRLSTLDVGTTDITDWRVSLQQATLVVDVEASENTPAVTTVVLAYGPDVSDDFEQFPLALQNDGTYLADTIPIGSYTLITECENGMRLQQPLELNSDRDLTISVPDGSSLLSGTFTNPSPYTFFLANSDQRVRFDLEADAEGPYVIEAIPADNYSLSAVVNNLRLDFMDIDLESEQELMLDIDAGELLAGLSPLYAVVTDTQGVMLSNAQVWVTGAGEVVTTESTGRGAFLALIPGEYTLYAALPGYSTAEQAIVVQPSPLQAPPNPDNTVWLRLSAP